MGRMEDISLLIFKTKEGLRENLSPSYTGHWQIKVRST